MMLRYVIKRLIYMIPTLFGMSIIAFMIIQLPPGDFVTSLIGRMTDSGQTFDPAQIERIRDAYGLNDPIWVQYWKWISGILLRGDFGYSFEWNRPVADLIWERTGSTLAISVLALLFVWAVSRRSASTRPCAAIRSATTSSPSSASSASPSPTSSWR